jgi:MFS family permease
VCGPLRPFRATQYRWLAASTTLALVAAGVWAVAIVWQVVAIGGGPAELSVVATAAAAGMLGASLIGGVAADRISQRRILLAVSTTRAAALGALAALSLGGGLQVWHLTLVALVCGVGNAFQYPAYSALLPSIVAEDDLMAANGFEGMLRPAAMQALGPAVASATVTVWSPGAALAAVAFAEAAGVWCLTRVRPVALRREDATRGLRAAAADLRDGFTYMRRTPWLLSTTLFASALILVIMGPVEVLIPFAIKDNAGGGPGDHAVVLAAFGAGGVLGSLWMASRPMPRRYLTAMNLMWGVGCVPMAVIGFASEVWVIAAATFLVGVFFNAPMVIWGTLLQRRVPPALLGRVSSLDFFVSLVFMPISMAVAGPVSQQLGLGLTFLAAGLLPTVFALAAIAAGRLPQDELANPLVPADDAEQQVALPLPDRDVLEPLPAAA